ncbi:LysR family transcriptional regulator [Galbitalea soli]|uniref:LysR family transcriptional regulator n=2 Tax=Galbitalea soli TaxID=1268042 RepID=A0A7C9TNR6_9MICO|nr:LysR family transcriptional regulator [Galbitalea soli]
MLSIMRDYEWMTELDLDLHSLRIVRAISDTGTITGAARVLGFSQPAISQHLQRAEARLGVPLVIRAGRGIRLTEAGQLLARHAVTISSALDAAAGDLAELAGMRTGTARIAGFPTASSTIIPRLLHTMASQHPGIVVTYIEAEPPEAIGMLGEGAVDLAITFSYPGDRADPHRDVASGLHLTPLFTEEVVLALPARHPLAVEEAVDVSLLDRERWIAGCPLCRGHLLAVCEAAGFDPVIDYETDNAVAVLNLVAADVGVALLPRLALATAAVPPGAAIRATAPVSTRDIQLVSHAGAVRVPSLAATIAAIRAVPGADWGLTPVGAVARAAAQ